MARENEFDLLSVAGKGYFEQKATLVRIKELLAPHVPDGARLAIKENDHEFGYYPSLVVRWSDDLPRDAVEKVFALETLAIEKADELGVDY